MEQTIRDLLQQATELHDRGNYPAAIEICQQVLQINPQSHKAYHHLGESLARQGQLAEAMSAYTSSLAIQPDFFWSHHNLSLVLFRQGNFERAVVHSRKAIELNPKNKNFHHHLGKILAKQKKFGAAIKSYQQAISIDENFGEAHQALGEIYEKQDKHEGALNSYQKAVALLPESADLTAKLGEIYFKQQQWQPAIDSCRRAIELGSNSPWTYYNLGYSYYKLNRHQQAISCYAKALAIDPGFAPAYQRLMFSKLDPKQLDEVVRAFNENIKKQPNTSWLYVRLGDLLTKQNQIPEAIDNYKNATYKLNAWHKPEYTARYWQQGEIKGPNFIILGAMKAGTTSLYEYICQHPQALHCAQKEVHFFVHHWDLGLDWYLSHFPPVPQDKYYITGEASPGYFCNTVQSKVKETFPNLKPIVILRNPVDRAISHYYHNVKYGLEMRPFEEAIARELEVMNNLADPALIGETANWSKEQGYLFTGLYVYFLQKWMSVFPKERFLIIKSEDLYLHPQPIMEQTFEFLELPYYQNIDYINYLQGSYSKIDEVWYQTIANFFATYNQKLEELLDMPFQWS